jgi:hypothetical protein
MQTKAKSNSVITHQVSENKIIFTVAGVASLELDLNSVTEAIAKRAMIHGLIQRISDAAAIPRNTETGLSATATEKYEAMKELVDHYNSGAEEWRITKASGERKESAGGLLKQCLVKMYPEKSLERIEEYLKGLSRKDKLALLHSPKVAKVADEIRAKGVSNVDAEELLTGL